MLIVSVHQLAGLLAVRVRERLAHEDCIAAELLPPAPASGHEQVRDHDHIVVL